MSFSKNVSKKFNQTEREKRIRSYTEPGYYLVRESDKKRFFISTYIDIYAFESLAEDVLSDETGYEYWIDYSYGEDVKGNPAWDNLDHQDKFFI